MSVKIIAEVAQGYEGKPDLARMFVRAAAYAGVDAVKFQCVYADEIATPDYRFYDWFKQLEMSHDDWSALVAFAKDSGIDLYLNIGGERSLKLAGVLEVPAVKIHATNFFNTELITEALERFSHVYLSIGGISTDEIGKAIKQFKLTPNGNASFTFGYQSSPTPIEKNNLNKLVSLKDMFPGYHFGFEPHTDTLSPQVMQVPLLGLPLGISHLEVHLTLDRSLMLEDAESAITPDQLKTLAVDVRLLEAAMGTYDLELTDEENGYRSKVLKRTVAASSLKAGHVLTLDDIALKRTSKGGAELPLDRASLIGKELLRDIDVNDPIRFEFVK